MFPRFWPKTLIPSIEFQRKLLTFERIKNDEGFTALELCNNEEIRKFLEEKIKELGSPEKDCIPCQMEYSQFAPPKPPIVMGWLFKTGPLIFNIKKRFFVLDPHDGTFIRFKRKEDYPLKPRYLVRDY